MTSDTLLCAALRLETLFPLAISELFRSDENDPLHRLPIGQVRLIRSLYFGDKTGQQLCETLRLSASSLAQITRRLIRAGLIEKSLSTKDRRIRHFGLTERGRTMMQQRQTMRAEHAAKVLSQMPTEKVGALIAVLEQLSGSHSKTPYEESVDPV